MSSLIFLRVLSLKDLLNKLKNSIDRHPKPTGTKDLFSRTGTHTIDSNPEILAFGDNMPRYMKIFESTKMKVHQLTRKLSDQFFEINKTILEIGDCYDKFSEMYKLCHCNSFSDLYKSMDEAMK